MPKESIEKIKRNMEMESLIMILYAVLLPISIHTESYILTIIDVIVLSVFILLVKDEHMKLDKLDESK